MLPTRPTRLSAAAMLMLSLGGLAATAADARRGGSFGSRGARTYAAPRQTYNSPRAVAPVERSMTPRSQAQAAPGYGARQAQAARPAGSRFGGLGGLGGGLLGGLIAGGLIGHFFGGGWNAGWGGGGAGGGMLAALLQLALLGGLVWLVVGLFRRRPQPAAAGYAPAMTRDAGAAPPEPRFAAAAPRAPDTDSGTDIAITAADQREFEALLGDVQEAFGREDHARLRQLTTPEIMSYLSEELSRNATRGVRNEVRGTRLIDAEVSEAWSEGAADYATIAFRYESVDVMRDRASGAIVEGSDERATETLEYWTFVRDGAGWKLSAIQEA